METTEKPTPAQDEAPQSVSISVPNTLTDEEYTRLSDLFNAKYDLEAHAFKSENLNLDRDDVWISLNEISADVPFKASSEYLLALRDFATNTTRVNHRAPAAGTSEKYAFRVWLNRIGLKGPQYKATRKALLANLDGSSSYAGRRN